MRPHEYLARAAADDLPLDLDDAIRHLGDHLPLLHRLADTELAGWMRELTSEQGARIRDIGEDGTLRTFEG